MLIHTQILNTLAEELLDQSGLQQLQSLIKNQPIDYNQLVAFDLELGGPSLSRLSCNGHGRYAIADREIFRPLHYCASYFYKGSQRNDLEWFARHIIHMSCLHIESAIKRIGQVWHLPLGRALREAIVRRKIHPLTWNRIDRFTTVYNDAKHNVSQPKDMHLFSIGDAVVAYIVSRKLGFTLYPLINLKTNFTIFDQPCG